MGWTNPASNRRNNHSMRNYRYKARHVTFTPDYCVEDMDSIELIFGNPPFTKKQAQAKAKELNNVVKFLKRAGA